MEQAGLIINGTASHSRSLAANVSQFAIEPLVPAFSTRSRMVLVLISFHGKGLQPCKPVQSDELS